MKDIDLLQLYVDSDGELRIRLPFSELHVMGVHPIGDGLSFWPLVK